ncbi:VOC family protein [Gimibacter soli]|uniref:VOC family protein n=1 Tax=Gimibacter soli TaxID=3024400 RepID=A0AAF0BJZ6_9PROT|nr:VOC family protein [Gimibacter soli]WCL53699.1 VOC family protein [Gimibacter soli]
MALKPLHSVKTVIRTGRFDEARAFYADILGLKVAEEWDEATDKGCIFALEGPGGFIELAATSQDAEKRHLHAERATGKVELQIRTEDLQAWAAHFARLGVPCTGPVARPWGNSYLWVEDPDGVRVTLFEGGL